MAVTSLEKYKGNIWKSYEAEFVCPSDLNAVQIVGSDDSGTRVEMIISVDHLRVALEMVRDRVTVEK